MITRAKLLQFASSKPVRTTLFLLGLLLIIAAPLIGPLPGPGGILVFAAGLSLALKNNDWAKRQYVRFKAWHPKAGRWTDWGLRRRSARRREELRRQRKQIGCPPPADELDQGPIAAELPDPPEKPPLGLGKDGA